MQKRIFLYTFIIFSSLISYPIFAKNESSPSENRPILKLNKKRSEASVPRNEEMRQINEEKRLERCETIRQRISTRTQTFYENKSQHLANYNALVTRAAEISKFFSSKGLDTSALDAHIQEFESLANQYSQRYSYFINTVENSNTTVCGEPAGEYRNMIKNASDHMQGVREQRQELRTYYATVLREDILNLRKELVGVSDGVENENEYENESETENE